MESIQIYLHSKNADKLYNNNISDAEYNLPPIEIPDGFHIYLSVNNATIPYSFYNVNNSNNILSYTLSNDLLGAFVNYYNNDSINYYIKGNYDYYTYNLSDDEGHILYNAQTQFTNDTLLISNIRSSVLYQLIVTFYIGNTTQNIVINQATGNSTIKDIINEIPIKTIINLTITNGNYNITQLVDYLLSTMTGFNIIYNAITNKLTFTHSTYNFIFLSNSTCLSVLGFNSKSSSTNLSLISKYCVNIMAIKRINISSNFITYNINKASLNNYSILCSVPVNKPPYSLIEYNNTNHFRTNLFINLITFIKIKLTDENGTLIDLNGSNYCITIQLDIEPFT